MIKVVEIHKITDLIKDMYLVVHLLLDSGSFKCFSAPVIAPNYYSTKNKQTGCLYCVHLTDRVEV